METETNKRRTAKSLIVDFPTDIMSTADVSKASGISLRNVIYYAEQGIITPSIKDAGGRGKHRSWNLFDYFLLCLLKLLQDFGMQSFAIQKFVSSLKSEFILEKMREILLSQLAQYGGDFPEYPIGRIFRRYSLFKHFSKEDKRDFVELICYRIDRCCGSLQAIPYKSLKKDHFKKAMGFDMVVNDKDICIEILHQKQKTTEQSEMVQLRIDLILLMFHCVVRFIEHSISQENNVFPLGLNKESDTQ